jgi:hypothetical protein
MKSEKPNAGQNRPSAEKPEFDSSVELIPPRPAFIEFVTAHRLWGIPIRQLDYFVLGNNPEPAGKKTLPTDLLILVFETSTVFLFGWRLELLLDPLMHGRVKRIRAGKLPGTLMTGEPWVSEIKIAPRFEADRL